ncbi:MAG: crossover junction endodeoxyribonuclease RuvC, partial [Candidatus Pacebacteria bacterium]|nr:crossover junction endodeoxyribonuclease RuvC [Candidatus Paceibacterota bacterium]
KKIPISEITPLQVKMTITGYGRADKKQVQKMIKNLLDLKEIPKPDDAADALGVAICSLLMNSGKSP